MSSREDEELELKNVEVLLKKYIYLLLMLWNEFSKVHDLNRHVIEAEVSHIKKPRVSIIFVGRRITAKNKNSQSGFTLKEIKENQVGFISLLAFK